MNEVEKYILMRREVEMGNQIEEQEKPFFDKMNNIYQSDLEFKNMIDMTLKSTSRMNMNAILNGTKEEEDAKTILIPVDEIKSVTEKVEPTEPIGGEEKPKTLVLSNKSGYADVLTLAVATGFILGTATTILFILL